MDVLEAMQTLNACRYYKTDPVPDALVAKVLNSARWAATGSNNQPVSYVVVRDAAKRRAIHDLYQPIWDMVMQKYASGEIKSGFDAKFLANVDHFARHLADVPVHIVVCANWKVLTALDANLDRTVLTPGSSVYPAVQNLMLAARSEGLGTVLTTLLVLAEKEIRTLLNIPDDLATAAVITLGWPAKPFPKKLKRKPLATTAFLDSYGAPLPHAEQYV
ncbi:MAG: nitroreductase family protein [Gammaproteobacteria bacterium]